MMVAMKLTRYILWLFTVILFSCVTKHKQTDVEKLFDGTTKNQSLVKYATQFDIYVKDGVTRVDIYDPANNTIIAGSYYIANQDEYDRFKPNQNLFKSPLDSVVLFSATQINAFGKLGLLNKIVGVSEASYVNNTFIRDQIAKGNVKELAVNGNIYTERTMLVNPSVIFYSPYISAESYSLELIDIPVIPYYDYLEENPLGRAEWIKFSAVFFGKYAKADSLFKIISDKYSHYRQLTGDVRIRPTVFSDKFFNGQWYVPGGQSYIAHLFNDAGAEYIWKDDDHTGSFPLDYEVVYDKAHDADFWRIVGSYGEKASYNSLEDQNELYSHFKAFTHHKIIWCDAESSAYFEKSPLEPDRVLADLIKAFHPELLPEYRPKYYYVMK